MSRPAFWSPADRETIAGKDLRLFALIGSEALGLAIAQRLGIVLNRHEERDFEDGEHKGRPLDGVAGCDVYVVHSLFGEPRQSANDKLCRLLFFIGALKDAGAARVTAVVPYLCYSRKDRRTKTYDPVTTKYIAAVFEALGTEAIVTLEVHNVAAFQNAFRCRAIALSSVPLQIDKIIAAVGDRPVSIISPDLGGGKRAELLRETLESVTGRPVGKAFADKTRSAGVVSGDLFVGDVAGTDCFIVDDLISTGGTLARAAKAAKKAGAGRVFACVTHGLFMPGACDVLADPAIEAIIISDTVPPFRLQDGIVRDKLIVAPAAPLFAAAISRLHENRPLADLLVF